MVPTDLLDFLSIAWKCGSNWWSTFLIGKSDRIKKGNMLATDDGHRILVHWQLQLNKSTKSGTNKRRSTPKNKNTWHIHIICYFKIYKHVACLQYNYNHSKIHLHVHSQLYMQRCDKLENILSQNTSYQSTSVEICTNLSINNVEKNDFLVLVPRNSVCCALFPLFLHNLT